MRWIIAILTAAAALVAALNEVASLDRFAAEKLHFPANLSWSLPGMVTIATLAGALMWTLLQQVPLRQAGKRLNLACAGISALAVGLDHASGAEGWWIVPAGLVGALVPALATWLTHLLARMTADQPKPPVEVLDPSLTSTGTTQPTPDEPEPITRIHLVTQKPAQEDRATELIAAGAGRKRLARELDITESAARRLLEGSRPKERA